MTPAATPPEFAGDYICWKQENGKPSVFRGHYHRRQKYWFNVDTQQRDTPEFWMHHPVLPVGNIAEDSKMGISP